MPNQTVRPPVDRQIPAAFRDQRDRAAGFQGSLQFGALHVAAERQRDEAPAKKREQERRPAGAVADLEADRRPFGKSIEALRQNRRFRLDFRKIAQNPTAGLTNGRGRGKTGERTRPGGKDGILGNGVIHNKVVDFGCRPVPLSGMCPYLLFPVMKADIHPRYEDTTITCACGTVYHTRSTKRELKIGICAACHPFFTGEQKFVDTAGRIEKFSRRYASIGGTPRRKGKS